MDTITKTADPRTSPASLPIEPTDSELLFDFVVNRNQPAFETLVRKHSAMVLGVCRQILCDNHEAEDAFQATFLILASQGRKISKASSLAAWLHRVAFRVAMRAAKRRQSRPKAELEDVAVVDNVWEHITRRETQTILNEELARLPQRNRAAIVLCHLQGKSQSQAAEEMECTTGAVKALLARGKRTLRMRLARRGVLLAAAFGLAAITTREATAATLESLSGLTSEAISKAILQGNLEMLSTNVAALARKGISAMSLSSAIRIGFFTAMTIVVGSGFIWSASFAAGDAPSAAQLKTSKPSVIDVDLNHDVGSKVASTDKPIAIAAVAADDGFANDHPRRRTGSKRRVEPNETPQNETALMIASLEAKIEAMKLMIEAKAAQSKLTLARLKRLEDIEGANSSAPADRHIADLTARAEDFRLRGELFDLQRQLLVVQSAPAAENNADAAVAPKQSKADTIIAPGDMLMVDIVAGGEPFVSRQIRVEANGNLPLSPQLGRVEVDGLTFVQAEAKIQKRLAQLFRTVAVQITTP